MTAMMPMIREALLLISYAFLPLVMPESITKGGPGSQGLLGPLTFLGPQAIFSMTEFTITVI